MGEAILSVRNVGFRYASGLPVLLDISFDCNRSESVSVMGASGIGKTTLCRIIAGLTQPSTGGVFYKGQPVRRPSPKITVSFQDSACFPWLTVKQNLLFGLKGIAASDRKEKEEHAIWLIEQVGLKNKLDEIPRRLSGGMRQRLSVARCLAVQPDVLILDEPVSALDPVTKKKLKELLQSLQEKMGFALISVLHSLEDAFTMGQRVIVLSGRPAQVCLDVTLNGVAFGEFESKVMHALDTEERGSEAADV